jgi:hypothetical protein
MKKLESINVSVSFIIPSSKFLGLVFKYVIFVFLILFYNILNDEIYICLQNLFCN